MLLFKCSCGCLFTTKDKIISAGRYTTVTCWSCGASAHYCPETQSQKEIEEELSKEGLTVQKVPDDAKITVTFDA